MTHPFITETPLRLFLRGQIARLQRVIAESDQPWRVNEARRHLARFQHLVGNETDMSLDLLAPGAGQSGSPAAIDDICRHVEAADFTRAIPHAAHGFLILDADDRRAA